MDVTTARYVSGLHLVPLYITLYSYSDPGRIVDIQVSGKTIASNTDRRRGWLINIPALIAFTSGKARKYYLTITIDRECRKTAPVEGTRWDPLYFR